MCDLFQSPHNSNKYLVPMSWISLNAKAIHAFCGSFSKTEAKEESYGRHIWGLSKK